MHLKQSVSDKNLTDLARWASFAVQLVGYFPLTSKSISGNLNQNQRTYKFTWTGSILPYYSSLLTAASFTWCLVYFLRYHEFQSFSEFKSATEVAANNLMIITSTLSALYIKIFALAKGIQYQKFWEHTQALLANFSVTADLRKIGTSCMLDFFLMIIPIIGHILYFHVRILLASFLDNWSSDDSSWTKTDTQLYLGLTFWSVFALLHISNSIWMNFFVKIYTYCLKSVAVDLRNLTRHQSNIQNYRNQDDADLSRIYHEINREKFNSRSSDYSSNLREALDKLTLVDHEISRFNKFFGNIILLQVGNCVMNLLVFSFFACLWMGRGQFDHFAETIIPMYLYGKELLDMGTVAEELFAASEKVLNRVVEDLELGGLSEEMFLKIQMVATQLCTKPPVVSARQFFTINRSLVTSVMSALATFLVVLVQFRDQDDEDAKVSAVIKATKGVMNSSPAISMATKDSGIPTTITPPMSTYTTPP